MHKSKDGTYPWQFQLMLWIAFVVCRLLMMTWRVRVVGMDRRRRAVAENPRGSFVIATFHENAIAGVLSHPDQGIAVLASRSKDGEFVAYIAERVGLKSVRGSSSRGGKEARDEMTEYLRSGVSAAVTVDGPRGPRRQAKAGVVDVARKSSSPILPITCVADRCWILNKTWDKTRIPKPFAKVLVYYGEPIFVAQDCQGADFDQIIRSVDQILSRDDDLACAKVADLWAEGRPFIK